MSATSSRPLSTTPARPSAVEAPDSHVAKEVLLEFGGRNVIDPNERHAIVPDMAALTDSLDCSAATVTGLSPARTFREKATLIHAACHCRRLANRPDRLSRPWFDLACRAALGDRALPADVVRHETVFFHAGNANQDRCLDGRLHLVPDDDQLPALQSGYDAMRAARIVGDDAPGFDALIERIRAQETEAHLASLPASQSRVQPRHPDRVARARPSRRRNASAAQPALRRSGTGQGACRLRPSRTSRPFLLRGRPVAALPARDPPIRFGCLSN